MTSPMLLALFCLAILYICLNLVWSSPCSTGEISKALPILLSLPILLYSYNPQVARPEVAQKLRYSRWICRTVTLIVFLKWYYEAKCLLDIFIFFIHSFIDFLIYFMWPTSLKNKLKFIFFFTNYVIINCPSFPQDVLFLSQFMSPKGYILNRRVTGTCFIQFYLVSHFRNNA